MMCSWLGFIAGMDYYIRNEGALALHAPMACVYFGITFFSVYLGLKPMLRMYRRLLAMYADLPLVQYVPGVMTDVITAVLMFTSFGITKESGNSFLSDKTTAEVKSGMQFTLFNQFMLYYGNPLLFLSIVLFAFVQPEQKHFRPSFLNYFLVNSRIMGLLGRCSLAIYLCQLTFMNCYYPLVIAGIQHHQYPYTRSFAAEYDNSSFAESRKAKYYFPGIILIVLVGIFIQKVYQDQLIVRLHLWFVQWSQKRRAAALSSSSITPQTQAPFIREL